jgi:RNA polymerase sigma factor (sigma-70 family)
VRPAARDFADESDADLMVYMSMAADDPAAAQDAWAEFYSRHVDYTYAVCLRAYGGVLCGDTGVADLVTETFRKAYRNAHLFDAGGIEEAVRLRHRVRAWLGRIAQRLFQDILRARRRLETVHLAPEMWQQIPDSQPRTAESGELVERVQEALGELSEKEQLVIRVTFQWYRPGQAHQRLPNDVVADLAQTLATTPENLRQIRRRALRKIREYLEPTRTNGV